LAGVWFSGRCGFVAYRAALLSGCPVVAALLPDAAVLCRDWVCWSLLFRRSFGVVSVGLPAAVVSLRSA
jgi:hypothetical protein